MTALDEASGVVRDAIERRVFPGAVAEVGATGGVIWHQSFGRLTFDADSAAVSVETPYDLASLTKVLATTPLIMQVIAGSHLALDEPISASFGEWRGTDREAVTVRDLLEHTSGLAARLVDAPPAGRREFEHDICTMPLEYKPRSQSIYSDLGFILLGFLIEDRGGAPLATQFDSMRDRLQIALSFELAPELRKLTAPTLPLDEDPRRGRLLVGEVHDPYAAALGGAAGHAGLFGTASAVGAMASLFLRGARGANAPMPFSAADVSTFTTRSAVPGSSRALGWDTMLATSSCGSHMSPAAFGHVGFTGTSLWIDPVSDRYYVLLANRACGGGSIDAMRAVRRAFHDALTDA